MTKTNTATETLDLLTHNTDGTPIDPMDGPQERLLAACARDFAKRRFVESDNPDDFRPRNATTTRRAR